MRLRCIKNVFVYLGGALAARHNVVERRARVTASIPLLMHTYSNTPSPASCVRSVLAGGGRGQLQLGSLLTHLDFLNPPTPTSVRGSQGVP